MRFRAVLNAPSALRDLHGIISTLARIHKECTLRLDPHSMQFIIAENLVQGTPWLWSDCDCRPAAGFCAEYTMQGVDATAANNRIVMSINTVKLASALAQLGRGQARYVKMKLTNRQFPCLTMELEVPSASAAANSSSVPYRRLTHDVPVTLVAVRDWPEFDVPQTQSAAGDDELHGAAGNGNDNDDDDADDATNGSMTRRIGMPSMRSLRQLVDRLKNLAPAITVYYNNAGELYLVTEAGNLTVNSLYRNLPMRWRRRSGSRAAVGGGGSSDAADRGEVACRVSSKQLAMILGGLQMAQTAMWCCIVKDVLMNLRVEISEAVSVTCMFNVVAL